MSRAARLERLEADLHATVQRVTAEVVERIKGEASIPERRAFCRVAGRALELRQAGDDVLPLPGDGEVVQDGGAVRLAGCGAVLCTAAEWPMYLTVARRVVEIYEEAGGPAIGIVAP
jgi:hypothetical protein